MKKYRVYMWIAVGAITGGLIAAIVPGMDVAVGIGCGVAGDLAAASGEWRTVGRRCSRAGRANSPTGRQPR